MTLTYAIGDIHGQRGMLEDMLASIDRDNDCNGTGDAQIVFLGDYVDRGPDSAGVLDLLAQGLGEGRNWVLLKGNHDRMMEWFLEPESRHDPHLLVGYHWLHDRIGGLTTLASYGVDAGERRRLSDVSAEARDGVPQAHMDLLRGLQLSHRQPGRFFCHAGVRPGVPLDDQVENDLLWIRQEFLIDPLDHGALIVHGHTPVDTPDLHRNRLNLDTGAGYGRPLGAAVFDGGDVFAINAMGRVKL